MLGVTRMQKHLVGRDPTVESVAAVRTVRGTVRHQIRFAVGRMFQVLSEVHEVRGTDLDRFAVQGMLSKERSLRRARRLRPGLAEIGGPAEADEWAEPRPVVRNAVAWHLAARMQTIGAVVPHAVIEETAARITPGVR